MANSLQFSVVTFEAWEVSQRITLLSCVSIWEGCFSWLLRSKTSFHKALQFLSSIWSQLILLFLKTNFLSYFFSVFQDKIDPVQIMFYSFSKLSCQVIPDYNLYMYSSQNMKKRWRKLWKIMMKMMKFLQYLESSDKFRKNLFYKGYRSMYQQKDNFISFSLLFS